MDGFLSAHVDVADLVLHQLVEHDDQLLGSLKVFLLCHSPIIVTGASFVARASGFPRPGRLPGVQYLLVSASATRDLPAWGRWSKSRLPGPSWRRPVGRQPWRQQLVQLPAA